MLSLRLLLLAVVLLLSNTLSAQPARPPLTMARGLTGTYYAGRNFDRKAFTRVDPTINFRWWRDPPGPGLDWQFYSVRWTGRLFTPVTGRYRFTLEVDDGVRVWVGGRKIIDAWELHDNVTFEGSIDLIAGRYYDLRVDYFNDILEGEIKLYWATPDDPDRVDGVATGQSPQIISPYYLGREPVRLAVAPTPRPVVSKPQPVAVRLTAKSTVAPVATNQRVIRTLPAPAQQRTSSLPVAATTAAPSAPVFEQLTAGETVVLQHVFFEQSDYRLLPASHAELDKLVRTMQQQPTLRIEIAGHTDNQGDPRLNLALSEHRAKVVANYLTQHGVAEERLTPKGYGGSRPLTNNVGESARAQNRRVEFIVQ